MPRVTAACRDKQVWIWVCVMNNITGFHEAFRKWGNGCECHEDALLRNETVVCHRMSRRLKEAASKITKSMADLLVIVGSITLDDCEADGMILRDFRILGHRVIGEIRICFSWVF